MDSKRNHAGDQQVPSVPAVSEQLTPQLTLSNERHQPREFHANSAVPFNQIFQGNETSAIGKNPNEFEDDGPTRTEYGEMNHFIKAFSHETHLLDSPEPKYRGERLTGGLDSRPRNSQDGRALSKSAKAESKTLTGNDSPSFNSSSQKRSHLNQKQKNSTMKLAPNVPAGWTEDSTPLRDGFLKQSQSMLLRQEDGQSALLHVDDFEKSGYTQDDFDINSQQDEGSNDDYQSMGRVTWREQIKQSRPFITAKGCVLNTKFTSAQILLQVAFIANLLAQHRVFDLNVSTLNLSGAEQDQRELLLKNVSRTANSTRQDLKEIQLPYNINPLTIVFAGQVIGILIFHIIRNNCFKSESNPAAASPVSLGSKLHKGQSSGGNMLSQKGLIFLQVMECIVNGLFLWHVFSIKTIVSSLYDFQAIKEMKGPTAAEKLEKIQSVFYDDQAYGKKIDLQNILYTENSLIFIMLIRIGIINGYLLKSLVYQWLRSRTANDEMPVNAFEDSIKRQNKEFDQNNRVLFLNVMAIVLNIIFRLPYIEEVRFCILILICCIAYLFIVAGSMFKAVLHCAFNETEPGSAMLPKTPKYDVSPIIQENEEQPFQQTLLRQTSFQAGEEQAEVDQNYNDEERGGRRDGDQATEQSQSVSDYVEVQSGSVNQTYAEIHRQSILSYRHSILSQMHNAAIENSARHSTANDSLRHSITMRQPMNFLNQQPAGVGGPGFQYMGVNVQDVGAMPGSAMMVHARQDSLRDMQSQSMIISSHHRTPEQFGQYLMSMSHVSTSNINHSRLQLERSITQSLIDNNDFGHQGWPRNLQIDKQIVLLHLETLQRSLKRELKQCQQFKEEHNEPDLETSAEKKLKNIASDLESKHYFKAAAIIIQLALLMQVMVDNEWFKHKVGDDLQRRKAECGVVAQLYVIAGGLSGTVFGVWGLFVKCIRCIQLCRASPQREVASMQMRGVQERQSVIAVLSAFPLVFLLLIHACHRSNSAKAIQFVQLTQGIVVFAAMYVLAETSKSRDVNYGDFTKGSDDKGWRLQVEFVNQMLVEHNCSIKQLVLQVTMISALAYAAETEFVMRRVEAFVLVLAILAFAWAVIDICIASVAVGQMDFKRSAARPSFDRDAMRQINDINMRTQLEALETQQQAGFSHDPQEDIINNNWKISRLETQLEDLERTIKRLESNSTPQQLSQRGLLDLQHQSSVDYFQCLLSADNYLDINTQKQIDVVSAANGAGGPGSYLEGLVKQGER